MRTYLGMDFGGTKLLIGEVAIDGKILRSKSYRTNCRTQDEAVRKLIESLEDYKHTVSFVGDITAGGVGIVGVTDHEKGLWISMNHEIQGPPIPLGKLLTEQMGVGVAVDNDVRSATTAEWLWGHGRMSDNFVYINIGTGLAAGFVTGGRLIRGANNNSGEIGHMVVNLTDEDECICGRKGCAENIISGSGFLRQALKHDLQEIIVSNGAQAADVPRLIRLVEEGNPVSRQIVDYAVDTLACIIMNLVRVTDPDTIILGGGVVSDGWLLHKVKGKLNANTMRGVVNGVVLSQLDPQSIGLLGAAAVGLVSVEKRE